MGKKNTAKRAAPRQKKKKNPAKKAVPWQMKKNNPVKKIAPWLKQHALPLLCGAAVLLAAAVCLLFLHFNKPAGPNVAVYKEKLALLEASVLTEETQSTVGASPAGDQAGQAVFFSICDTTERARVFCGTGPDLPSAWNDADRKATAFLKGHSYDPAWVKADVVYTSDTLTQEELTQAVHAARSEFYRYGVAFDPRFKTALLEAELNGAKIYDYGNDSIDLEYLNRYLKKADRSSLKKLPDSYIVFQCAGWFCDEENTVYELSTDELDCGRRKDTVDADYARDLIMNASAFLEAQVQEDGSFIYGIYPRFDNEINNYNIVRHAGTIWSLVCRYRLAPDKDLAEKIDQTIGFMLDNMLYDSEGRAYLYEEKSDEIKLGGCGIAVLALTEYADVFQDETYTDVCRALGEGILNMMDQDTGEYYHVLNGDFTRKEAFRTVYYDGEATYALCRLYGLTGDPVWLDAAKSAVAHFIEADYTQYKDHWIAYSMNEITKYVTDNEEYYAFALANAQENLEVIRDRDTTYHTYLELLMATFEVFDRMQENGISVEDFDLEAFLDTIATRVNRQLNGYFYPEYAMYMENPQRILNTFMVRHDGYRVRIDDVQHNIGGYYLYAKNYDKLLEYGLHPSEEQKAIQAMMDKIVNADGIELTLAPGGGGRVYAYTIPSLDQWEDGQVYWAPYRLDSLAGGFQWEKLDAPPEGMNGTCLTIQPDGGPDCIQLWDAFSLVAIRTPDNRMEYYQAVSDQYGEPLGNYSPFQRLRAWFDEVELSFLRTTSVPDRGQSHLEVVEEWIAGYMPYLQCAPGSQYACTYVSTVGVTADQPNWISPWELETWAETMTKGYDAADFGKTWFGFSFNLVFVPENENARQNFLAGNTVDYPDEAPEGAQIFSRVGYMELIDGNWVCEGVGTGW